jgi:hypothetical protein
VAICGGRSRRLGPLRCDWFELYAIERASDEVWKCDDRWERRADTQRPWDSVRPSRGRSCETHWRISTGVRRFAQIPAMATMVRGSDSHALGRKSRSYVASELRAASEVGVLWKSESANGSPYSDFRSQKIRTFPKRNLNSVSNCQPFGTSSAKP